MKKVLQKNVRIISHKKVNKDYFKIILSSSGMKSLAKPGQFLEIKITDSYEPLLRRPFSIHRFRGQDIEILYKVVGCGSEILSQKRKGEYLDVIGPLGNGFNYQLPITNYQLPILVAGGMGVAPLLFLAEKLVKFKVHSSKFIVLIGARTKGGLLCVEEFKRLGYDVKLATDDGSKGSKGKVTELLKKILPLATSHKPLAIYACGPRPMLKEIAYISQQYNIQAQVSLEEHMACGIGACLGCVVKTKDGYKRVCKDGPVFKSDEVVW